ncbi:tumor necrosis factor ligand superfamily member 10 [Lingula anatina]|uniref:Tumor necrosis factor ligand superfamily member 10 n=1 Tax=Lingula anatina TaxID=7574 RepID=A0A1S3I5L4_LINAN|nr:tumor necrosis factor ligand superfamily member 10 [Lingula anatina]|eukprot:XP_013392659.1 tumor necrosis factor ligand superfamily member 10 [Lingula anatina]
MQKTPSGRRPEVNITAGGISFAVPNSRGQRRNDSVSTQDSDSSLISSASSSDSADARKDYEAQTPNDRQVKRIGKVAFTSIIIAVVVTVANVGVVAFVIMSENSVASDIENFRDVIASIGQFCLPCTDVMLTSPEENAIIADFRKQVTPEGVAECCAKDKTQFNMLLQRYVERKLRLIRSEGTLHTHPNGTAPMTSDKPSAHLLYRGGNSTPRGFRGQDGMYTITNWAKGSLGYISGVDFHSHSGSFVIKEEGRYFIYSQALFLFTYQPSDVTSAQKPRGETVVHSIYRNNIRRAAEEEMMTGRKSNCWSTEKTFEVKSNYLGGVIYLRAGDEVYVKVSDLTKVKINDFKSTYFGLYML